MRLLSKAPLILVLIIAAIFILDGVEATMLGFPGGMFSLLLGIIIIVFFLIYLKISEDK